MRPQEFDAQELVMIGDTENYGSDEVITSGDLCLMKVTHARAEARKKYYEGATKAQADAIQQRIHESNLDNSSRSIVRTGKHAHFSGK